MNRFILYWAAAGTCLLATQALAQLDLRQPVLAGLAAYDDSYTRPNAEESPSDQPEQHVPGQLLDVSCPRDSDPACGCGGDCCLGDAWTLKDCLTPCCEVNYGGWIQAGYHSDNTGLSAQFNDLLDFNDVPDQLNLHQAWLYAEKLADGSRCCWDWGYRLDVVYGTDAQKTQAFGNEDNVWDVSFDNGEYGWAIPQAYAELAYGDWSVKIGHFFSLVGYEVVPAIGNFFYSHSLAFYNSETLTDTGVLGAYKASDCTTYHLGWALGWDTGFDQFGDGSIAHAGFVHQATGDVSVAYIMTAGNFGFRSGNEGGYSHSVVVIADLNARTQYVLQNDYIHTNGLYDDPTFESEDYGIDQYLFYTLNNCWKLGTRMEWWKSNQVTGESTSFYEITGGLNYKPRANVVIRPEMRYDWSPTEFVPDYNRGIFGVDAIFTF